MKRSTTQEKAPRRQYDAAFKSSAVKLVNSGRSVSDVAKSLGINENLLRKWRSSEQVTPVAVGPDAQEQSDLLRYIRQLETERDILKKALSIFSRTS